MTMGAGSPSGKRKRVPIREEVRHTLIALVAFEPNGTYAYDLDRRLRVLSEGFWAPYSGEVSRTLNQLEADGDISSQWDLDNGRPKRVFTVTSRGVQRTDAWLHAEISTDPRPLRDQLWYRFIAHRARMRDASELTRDVRIRRETAFQHLRRLDEQLVTIDAGDRYAPFIRVSLRMHVLEWQAELGMLDEIERELTLDLRGNRAERADDAREERERDPGGAPAGKTTALA